MGKKKQENGSFWAFALINGRLAEFNFEISKGKFFMTYGHCYVRRREYKTKQEQKWIDKDTQKYQFTFRNKKYWKVGERKSLPTRRFRISKKEKMIPFEALQNAIKIS